MKVINHVAMYVVDLEAAKEFFVRYFDANSNEMYHNPRTGLRSYFLSFEGGSVSLEIMNRPEVIESEKSIYRSGFIHLSFSVVGKEKVDELTKTLSDAGYEVLSGPRTTGDGFYESCIIGPEGNLVEIME